MADRSFKFWDRMAGRYSRIPLADEAAYLEKLTFMKGYLDSRSHALEFGCGTGSTAILLSPHAGNYTALDYSPRMIDIARGKTEGQGLETLRFECAAIADYPLENESLDVVIGMNVLHLLRDWRETIDKVFAALAPGGLFFSSTPCMADMNTPVRHLARLGGFMGLVPVLSVFTREEFTGALADAGFNLFHQWQPGETPSVFIAAAKPA